MSYNTHVVTSQKCVLFISSDPELLARMLYAGELELHRWAGDSPPTLLQVVTPSCVTAADEDVISAVRHHTDWLHQDWWKRKEDLKHIWDKDDL